MSSLTALEKRTLERMLGMGSGYVLNFSNRTFAEFILDVVGVQIYDKKYDYGTGSKANRMRAFWDVEPDHRVAEVLETMLRYAELEGWELQQRFVDEYQRIVERLKAGTPVPDLDALSPNLNEREFEVLAKSVRHSIEANEPEAGLDRLHTFVFRYVRVLAEHEGIDVPVGKPLHSVFGELVKALKRKGKLESTMGERILKSTISTLEAFNDVRNHRSFAHDNELLSYHEALLIYQHVASSIRFLAAIARDGIKEDPGGQVVDDFSF